MLRTPERIKEIKQVAQKNLKRADNSRDNLNKESYWSLYRADVRELLSLIEDFEEEMHNDDTSGTGRSNGTTS